MKSRTYEEVVAPRSGSGDLVIYKNAGKTTHNATQHEAEFMWCRNKQMLGNAPDLIYDFMTKYNTPLEQ